jgi:hypothetical protein
MQMQDVRCAPRPGRLSLRGRRCCPRSKVDEKGRESAAARGLILPPLGVADWDPGARPRPSPAFSKPPRRRLPSSADLLSSCRASRRRSNCFLICPRDLSGRRAARMPPPPPCKTKLQNGLFIPETAPPGTGIYKKGLEYCSIMGNLRCSSESIGEPCRIAICNALLYRARLRSSWARGGSWAGLGMLCTRSVGEA